MLSRLFRGYERGSIFLQYNEGIAHTDENGVLFLTILSFLLPLIEQRLGIVRLRRAVANRQCEINSSLECRIISAEHAAQILSRPAREDDRPRRRRGRLHSARPFADVLPENIDGRTQFVLCRLQLGPRVSKNKPRLLEFSRLRPRF